MKVAKDEPRWREVYWLDLGAHSGPLAGVSVLKIRNYVKVTTANTNHVSVNRNFVIKSLYFRSSSYSSEVTIMDHEAKRDLLYSLLSLGLSVTSLFMYGQHLEHLSKWELISTTLALYACLTEILKVLVVTYSFPAPYIYDGGSSGGIAGSSRGSRLPFSKRDNHPHFSGEGYGNVKLSGKQRLQFVGTKIMDLLKGTPNLAAGIAVGHILFILFGAPVFEKWRLTLGYSVILVSWLYFPLTLVIHPTVVLQEIMYLSSWRDKHASLSRAKWRFLLTLFGAWVGTVVIPLDWDRPWQQWPIPCIFSLMILTMLVNLVYSVYLFTKSVLWSNASKPVSTQPLTSSKSPTKNKNKNF